jgi:hypothetical protein
MIPFKALEPPKKNVFVLPEENLVKNIERTCRDWVKNQGIQFPESAPSEKKTGAYCAREPLPRYPKNRLHPDKKFKYGFSFKRSIDRLGLRVNPLRKSRVVPVHLLGYPIR